MPNELNIQQTSTTMAMSIASSHLVQRSALHSSDGREDGRTGIVRRGEVVPPPTPQSAKSPNGLSQTVDPTELETALTQLNEIASIVNEEYKFRLDQETAQLVVQITDQKGEVIRQIPPEAILQLASQIGKMIGMFLDENA